MLIQDYLLTKPLGIIVDTTERKKYLAYRILDYLMWCFSEDVNVDDLDVYFAKISQPIGVIVRFIIPLNNKALYFVIEEKVTLE